MHRIEPVMTPLKNDIVFGQKLFLSVTSLMVTSSTEDQNFKQLCDSLSKYKILALCHFWFWS